MCGQDTGSEDHAAVPLDNDPNADEAFPWDTGRVVDAHCHPTDTMASLAAIPGMGAAALTVMSTRAQDQDLVAALGKDDPKTVPAFGWHPWFSYQLHDDSGEGKGGEDLTSLEDKRRHLADVLVPKPSSLDEPASDKDKQLVAALDALAASLPAIRPLSAFIVETRQRLQDHPGALVGEIGVDKAFRVPEPATEDKASAAASSATSELGLTPGGREGRRLSPFRVQPAHQTAVLAAQLKLAAELQRPVSVHGVQAHGLLFSALAATWKEQEKKLLSHRQRHQIAGIEGLDDETSDSEDEQGAHDAPKRAKTYPPAICLHSFSGPVDMLQQYLHPAIPAAIYFSFSTAVNCSTANGCARTAEVVAACPDDRLLVESDLHVAGAAMDAALKDMYRRVCAIKKWTLAEGVAQIGRNYDAFIQKTRPKGGYETKLT
ncbi:Cut9-interacting protein scn1 [Sporothrix curviconia]|uniref:Cut9-interacting protein scn1 n=1 Tax=Sporothrix curviconia TaxID=1260050 RepID=A0ABP0BY12_9PEZI